MVLVLSVLFTSRNKCEAGALVLDRLLGFECSEIVCLIVNRGITPSEILLSLKKGEGA
ncbi:MAG: hypothetical protein ACJA1Z_000040 [Patiriisocius sp.]